MIGLRQGAHTRVVGLTYFSLIGQQVSAVDANKYTTATTRGGGRVEQCSHQPIFVVTFSHAEGLVLLPTTPKPKTKGSHT